MDFPAVVLLAATLPAPRLKTLVLVLLLDTVWEFITKMSQSEMYDEWDALGGFLYSVGILISFSPNGNCFCVLSNK